MTAKTATKPVAKRHAKPQLTGQQEIFAREYVRCGIASTAYRRAYNVGDDTKPETVYPNASRLLANTKVSARIQALQAAEAEVTVGELVNKLRISTDIAIEDRQPAAVTGAITALGKLKGYFKDDPAKAGDIHIHFGTDAKSLL